MGQKSVGADAELRKVACVGAGAHEARDRRSLRISLSQNVTQRVEECTKLDLGHRVALAHDRQFSELAENRSKLGQPGFGGHAGQQTAVEVELDLGGDYIDLEPSLHHRGVDVVM